MKEIDYYTEDNTFVATVEFQDDAAPEYISEYLEKYGPEMQYAEGLAEPGFGPVTMDFVPTESIERGLYGARQVGATLGTELGLLDKETASEDIAKMERYKEYSREQARREDFASGDIVVDPMTGGQVREGELEYYRDRDTLQNLAKAETFSDAISTFADNPGAVLPIIGESLGLFAPALVGTAAVGILTGGSGVPGIVATALAGGLGSGTTEYGSSFLQSFAENGVDVSDDEQVLAALNDETTLDSIREDAAKRGIAIGAFDAATIGFAGKLTTLIKGAPLAKATAEASLGRRLGAGGAEAGAQALGGGGGEATAQALTGEYKPGEILLEAVAEIPTTLPEVALGARAGRTRKLRNALVNKGYTDEQIEQFGSMTGNEQNKIIKELNEAPASTTFPSQRQMDREAEEVSTEAVQTAQELFPEDTDLGTAPVQETAPTRPATSPDFIGTTEGVVIPVPAGEAPITFEELEAVKTEVLLGQESDTDSSIRQSYDLVLDTFNQVLSDSSTVGRESNNVPFQEALTNFETQVEDKYPSIASSQKAKLREVLNANQPLPQNVSELGSASVVDMKSESGVVVDEETLLSDFASSEQRADMRTRNEDVPSTTAPTAQNKSQRMTLFKSLRFEKS